MTRSFLKGPNLNYKVTGHLVFKLQKALLKRDFHFVGVIFSFNPIWNIVYDLALGVVVSGLSLPFDLSAVLLSDLKETGVHLVASTVVLARAWDGCRCGGRIWSWLCSFAAIFFKRGSSNQWGSFAGHQIAKIESFPLKKELFV